MHPDPSRHRWLGPLTGVSLAALAVVLARGPLAGAALGVADPSPGTRADDAQPRPATPTPLAPPPNAPPEAVASYELDAALDAVEHIVTGHGVVRWRNTAAVAVDQLYLHLYLNAFADDETVFQRDNVAGFRGGGRPARAGGIRVGRLFARELAAELWPSADLHPAGDSDDETDVRVPLPRPIEPGERMTLDVAWTSTLPSIVSRTGFAGSFHMVAQWFPKLARLEPDGTWAHFPFHRLSEFYADFGDYDVRLDVPAGFTVGATGTRVSDEARGDRHLLRHVEHAVHDFAWTAWDGFDERRETTTDGVALRALYPRGSDAAGALELDVAARGLEHFGAAYGPYPYAELTIVHPPAYAAEAGGMEYPTLITTGGDARLAWLGVRNLEIVTVHELAHQWFYGLVASDEHRFPFLDEGLTSYATTEALEAWYPDRSALAFGPLAIGLPAVQRVSAASAWQNGALARRADEFATGADYGVLVYARTATVLSTFARVFGREPVARALGRYAREQRYAHPGPDALVAAFVAELGADAASTLGAALAGGWVDYSVDDVATVPAHHGGAQAVDVLVRRRGTLAFPVEITVLTDDGGETTETWDGHDDSWHLRWEGSSSVVSVVVDPTLAVLLDNDLDNNAWRRAPTHLAPQILLDQASLLELALAMAAW